MNILEVFEGYNPEIISRPYVIAEAGVNHEGDIEIAKRLIDEAARGGAHAIKFQTYKAETLASRDSPYYWDLEKEPSKNQFDLFK
ncbi:MAG: N-acetylneuraminate synthase family protein, partial [Ignavibacteria bacterium]